MTDTAAALSDYAELTSEIVGAYVAKNHVSPGEIPMLIRSVHDTLSDLGKPAPIETPAAPPVPAVPVRKSVTDEYIISLEDGRKFKSLKRYLATSHNMTPAEYRAKWNLPSDYPMVAPAYAAKRSELARSIGLGRKGADAATEPSTDRALDPVSAPPTKPEPAVPTSKRGKARKVA